MSTPVRQSIVKRIKDSRKKWLRSRREYLDSLHAGRDNGMTYEELGDVVKLDRGTIHKQLQRDRNGETG